MFRYPYAEIQVANMYPYCTVAYGTFRWKSRRFCFSSTFPFAPYSAARARRLRNMTKQNYTVNGSAMPDSLVHPDALNEVFDLVDANGDGVLTVHEFISVSPAVAVCSSPST